jgi:catechol 2,3-dioxygenase
VRDPDGNPVELSAELETRDFDAVPGEWKTEPRTLNLWGSAWTRD